MRTKLQYSAALLVVGFLGCKDIPGTVPDFEAATFSNPTQINNPFFPQIPGNRKTYRGQTPEGLEEGVVEVLSETRQILGVTSVVVQDTVTLDGFLIEDTLDFFAQDDEGNVWYMGEESTSFERDAAGNVLSTDTEGSWEAGKDVADLGVNALPGHAMPAAHPIGIIYNQEFYEGEAEDQGEVVSTDVSITLSDGTVHRCLQTHDFTPLEPDVNEQKFYEEGVGLIAEEESPGAPRIELISNQ